jgi:hypothetical protein
MTSPSLNLPAIAALGGYHTSSQNTIVLQDIAVLMMQCCPTVAPAFITAATITTDPCPIVEKSEIIAL